MSTMGSVVGLRPIISVHCTLGRGQSHALVAWRSTDFEAVGLMASEYQRLLLSVRSSQAQP